MDGKWRNAINLLAFWCANLSHLLESIYTSLGSSLKFLWNFLCLLRIYSNATYHNLHNCFIWVLILMIIFSNDNCFPIPQMLINLEDFDGNRTAILVNEFRIANEESGYRIFYKNFSSPLGRSLPAKGTKFRYIFCRFCNNCMDKKIHLRPSKKLWSICFRLRLHHS